VVVEFTSNSYLSLVRHDRDFKNNKAICSYVKNHPQFFYADVSFEKFSNSYSDKRSFLNRVTFLPRHALNSAILILSHLGLAVFKGVPQLASGNTLYLQSLAFSVVRDVQLITGCITDIFFEKIGQYLIQDALFHIQCYQCFITPSESSLSSPTRHSSSRHFLLPEPEEPVITNPNLLQAEEYLRQGKRQEALTEIKKIFLSSGEKETFLAKLAEAHLKDKDYEAAFKVIKEIIHDHRRKETFLAKLAEVHLEDKEYEAAFKVIKEIIHDPNLKEKLTPKLMQAYYSLEKGDQVIKVMNFFVQTIITNQLMAKRVSWTSLSDILKISQLMADPQMQPVLQVISTNCFKQTEGLWKQGKSQEAIQLVKQFALSDKVMKSFQTALDQL